jgi:hypothetical protein
MVDEDAKQFLDDFERVKDNLYTVMKIEVKDSNNQIHQVDAYLLDKYKENLLDDRVLFESYSSVNSHYKPYTIKKERPILDTNYIIKQLKD